MSMTKEEREEARKRCEEATEGPWYRMGQSVVDEEPLNYMSPTGPMMICDTYCETDKTVTDARFIAHARTDLPRALDELDAKDAEIERLKNELSGYIGCPFSVGDVIIARDAGTQTITKVEKCSEEDRLNGIKDGLVHPEESRGWRLWFKYEPGHSAWVGSNDHGVESAAHSSFLNQFLKIKKELSASTARIEELEGTILRVSKVLNAQKGPHPNGRTKTPEGRAREELSEQLTGLMEDDQ